MNKPFKNTEHAPKPTRRTEPREVRRHQLIDATIESIFRFGIGGTTMSSVTEIAGLSQGIVNFHFQSKQNLLEETLIHLAHEHHDQWVRAYQDAGLSAQEKLSAIVDAHFTAQICSRRKLSVWFAFYGENGRRDIYRDLIDEIDSERFQISTELCRELAGDSGAELPAPEDIAKTLESLYDGLWLNMLIYPSFIDRHDARRQIYTYLSGVFPAFFTTEEN